MILEKNSCMWQANGDLRCDTRESFVNGSIYNINVIIMSRDEQNILYNYTNTAIDSRGVTKIMRYAPPVLAIQEQGCIVLVHDMSNYYRSPRPKSLKLLLKHGRSGDMIPITFNNTLSSGNISMRTGRIEIHQIGSDGIELILDQ